MTSPTLEQVEAELRQLGVTMAAVGRGRTVEEWMEFWQCSEPRARRRIKQAMRAGLAKLSFGYRRRMDQQVYQARLYEFVVPIGKKKAKTCRTVKPRRTSKAPTRGSSSAKTTR